MRSWAAIGISLLIAGGCASHDESLGCAELVVTCPAGSEQQWWLANAHPSYENLRPQSGQCGSWLAFIENNATARYDNIDLGNDEGVARLRVVVAADDNASPNGGTLSLFADSDLTNEVTSCDVAPTGGWWNWVVVDCGTLPLGGLHSLTFKFTGPAQYVFNFAAFGVARAGPDCTVTGPKH